MKNLLLALLIISIGSVTAQVNERYSEEDVNVQSKIVKASQKKLLRKYEDAIQIYEDILEKDRNNTVALFDLSRIYLTINNEEKAIEFGEKALKKEPKNEWFKESLAEIKMHFKYFEEAGKIYQELAVIKKDNRNLYLFALDAFRQAENSDMALNLLQEMEKGIGPDSYSIQQTLGIHLNNENYKVAITKAKELMSLYPNDSEFIELNAQLESDFGSGQEAKRLYEKLLLLDPENSKALVFLARNDELDDELGSLKNIASNPNVDIDTKVKTLIPYAEKITKDNSQKDIILSIAHEIVTLHPKEAKAYALYGDLLNNSGNIEAAESQYMSALKHDKSVYAIWEQLMFIQYELGNFEGLLKSSTEALDYYPNQAAPYAFQGLAETNLNNIETGSEMLVEAKMIGTNSPYIKSIISLLEKTLQAYNEGDEIEIMSKEDLFMRGVKIDDPSIIRIMENGKFLVRVKKGS